MKDVETLQKENEDLRKELAQVKMQVRQTVASHKALGETYDRVFQSEHNLKMQLHLLNEDYLELKQEHDALKVSAANVKPVDSSLEDAA